MRSVDLRCHGTLQLLSACADHVALELERSLASNAICDTDAHDFLSDQVKEGSFATVTSLSKHAQLNVQAI